MSKRKKPAVFGPTYIGDGTMKILESLRGEPVDDETEDVIRDAIWEAFAQGQKSAALSSPPPHDGEGALHLCFRCGKFIEHGQSRVWDYDGGDPKIVHRTCFGGIPEAQPHDGEGDHG